MSRNGREGIRPPFCLTVGLLGSKSANIPVNWAKDEPEDSNRSKSDQFGEILEITNTREHLHKVNQIP